MQFAHLNEDVSQFKKVGYILKTGEELATIGATGNILTEVAKGFWEKPSKEQSMKHHRGVHVHIQTEDENGRLRTHAETAAWLQGKWVTASGKKGRFTPGSGFGSPTSGRLGQVYVDGNLMLMTGVTDENIDTLPPKVREGQYQNVSLSEFQSRMRDEYGVGIAKMRPVVEKSKKEKKFENLVTLTEAEKTLTPNQTEVKLSDVAQQLNNPRRAV